MYTVFSITCHVYFQKDAKLYEKNIYKANLNKVLQANIQWLYYGVLHSQGSISY